MAPEKKRVNLVNLKTQYGLFLTKYYACQSCHEIDALAIGFNCEHKFCLKCNNNQTDNCKECEENIENLKDDSLNNNLLPHFQDLKDIMNVDLKKIAAKYKNQQLNGEQQLNGRQNNHNEPEQVINQQVNNQPELNNQEVVNNGQQENHKEQEEENKQQQNDLKDNDESAEEEETNSTTKKANKSKKSTKKTNESKKNNQAVDEEPANRTTRSTRESNRSKEKPTLKDIIKESVEKPAVAAEKTVSKSTRKADKSTKSNTLKDSSELVIIATSISDNEIKLLNKFAKKFNARVVNEFTPEITHLVTLENKPNLTTRTLKYLKSLLTHKWLLNFKWILDSLENGTLVDESDYELLGITKQSEGNLGAPKRSRENPIELFKGKKFLIDGKFKQGLPKKDYEDLITIGGGELIDESDLDDNTYILIEQSYKSKFKGRKNTLFTNEFLNYVSDFKFDL